MVSHSWLKEQRMGIHKLHTYDQDYFQVLALCDNSVHDLRELLKWTSMGNQDWETLNMFMQDTLIFNPKHTY